MRRFLLLVAMLAVYAFGATLAAQDPAISAKSPQAKPTPTPAVTEKKTPPAEVILPADAALKLRDSAQQAAIKAKEAENLSLRIQLANVELEKLRLEVAKLQDAANTAYLSAAVKAGVPPGDEREYEGAINEKTGEMVLKRKPAPPKAAAKQ